MSYLPSVIEAVPGGERAYDLPSRLLKDRIIYLGSEVNNQSANSIVMQLLFLDSQNHNDIYLYINSPGGVITDGMAIYDTMKHIKSDVHTICVGMAASMGAFLLAGGTKGKRHCLPHATVMIHQPSGGAQGQATEISIAAERILKIKHQMNTMMSEFTGQAYEKVAEDTERDKYLTAEEALAYGIVDDIM